MKTSPRIIFLVYFALIISACGGLQPGPDVAQKYHDQGVLVLTGTADGRNPQKAVEYFSQALQAEPNFAKSYNARGVAYGLLGEYDKAKADFKKALEIDPSNKKAHQNLKHLITGEYHLANAIEP